MVRSPLPLLVSLALVAGTGIAQESGEGEETVKPGLYTTVDEAEIYLQQGDEQIDVKTGEAAFVTPDGMQFIDRPPAFLNWPCGAGFAAHRGQQPTYALDELPPGNPITAVVERWFTDGAVLEGRPSFLAGDFHTRIPAGQIDEYVDESAYWYRTGPATDKMAAQRPQVLLIGLFRGTGQVVVDTNHLDALKAHYGDEPIPVLFEYQDENVVPMSYYGPNATPSQVLNAYSERGIKAADLPMMFAGDRHLNAPPGELADSVGAPVLDEISPARRARLEQDLAENGFTGKPVNLSMIAGEDGLLADEAERLRVAQAMGMETVPVMFTFYNDNSPGERCGVAPPVAAVGALGLSDPGGEIPPDPISVPPEQPPPEVNLPNPPQPELPVSDN